MRKKYHGLFYKREALQTHYLSGCNASLIL